MSGLRRAGGLVLRGRRPSCGACDGAPDVPWRRLLTDAFSQSVPWELAAVRRRWRIASTSILEVERAGQLNKTKIAEGGRKLKKNWTTSLVVLTGNSLVFYKYPKVQAPSGWKPSNSKPESSMDLRGADIDWAQDMSSKKNVIHLRMVTGNEFLLQSDKEDVVQEWYDALQRVIERLERENPLEEIVLRRAGSMENLDGSGGEEDSPLKAKDSWKFSLSWVSNNVGGVDKKKVKHRLKKMLLKRPPLQTLQEKGLIKDQVFGCRLDALCYRERSTIPKFVRLCIEAVNIKGLVVDGIYRVNGNLSIIQKLRFIVDRERAVTTDGRYLFPEQLTQGSSYVPQPS
ncbi:unnamed protein product, partial [Ranitomeya imitator]